MSGAVSAGGSDTEAAHRAVELAARASYGRLVAILASRSHDVAAAEDALGDAFAAALSQWPTSGVPDGPEAWLVATARRRLSDRDRRARVADGAADSLAYAATFVDVTSQSPLHVRGGHAAFPDRRLGLLFACAHPGVDAGVRTPLMLQVVLGVDVETIASAFLVAPVAMAQRLVRAKRKLRDAGIPFTIPEPEELLPRLAAVLEAIYAAFGTGWDAVAGGDARRADLAEEAIWLGRLTVDALPEEAEARGLLALMLYCHARRSARSDASRAGASAGLRSGAYVPLTDQDPSQWSMPLIGEAEATLMSAARLLSPGRFQLEAAIQSAHLSPAFGRPRDWAAIVALYDALIAYAPTVGALVSRAAALGEASGAAAGLGASDAIPRDVAATYQPWWALRAHLLARLGRNAEAREAYQRAAGLTLAPSIRDFLLARRDALEGID